MQRIVEEERPQGNAHRQCPCVSAKSEDISSCFDGMRAHISSGCCPIISARAHQHNPLNPLLLINTINIPPR